MSKKINNSPFPSYDKYYNTVWVEEDDTAYYDGLSFQTEETQSNNALNELINLINEGRNHVS